MILFLRHGRAMSICVLVAFSTIRWLTPSYGDGNGAPLDPTGTAVEGALAEPDVCVSVKVGSDTAGLLSCLNREIRDQVRSSKQQAWQTQNVATSLTNASPTSIDLFNESAAHERLGNAFGHSVYPQRLPAAKLLPFFAAKQAMR